MEKLSNYGGRWLKAGIEVHDVADFVHPMKIQWSQIILIWFGFDEAVKQHDFWESDLDPRAKIRPDVKKDCNALFLLHFMCYLNARSKEIWRSNSLANLIDWTPHSTRIKGPIKLWFGLVWGLFKGEPWGSTQVASSKAASSFLFLFFFRWCKSFNKREVGSHSSFSFSIIEDDTCGHHARLISKSPGE